jgi:hypothetical protein
MEAGPELDALVAKKVMGWMKPPATSILKPMWVEPPRGTVHPSLPRFSTNISDAWEVLERIKSNGFNFFLGNGDTDEFNCIFVHPAAPKMYRCQAKTAPLAICMAALMVVGVEATENA